ncbi:MAG: DMT family transporter [Candidatus Limnocylindrales bacterium]
MIAVVGGLGAALCWAIATMSTSRSSKMIGPSSVLAWVMIVGAVVAFFPALLERPDGDLDPTAVTLSVVAGLAYIGGLSLIYRALRIGPVTIAAPVVSTEGALAAVIAVFLGEPLGAAAAVLLAIIAVGVILASSERPSDDRAAEAGRAEEADAGTTEALGPGLRTTPEITRRTAILAFAAAIVFAVGLVTSARAVTLGMPVMWVSLVARMLGVALVALPLLVTGRLRWARRALPFVVAAGVGEVVGTALYTIAAQDGIAIAAVLGAQFATISVVGAYLLFGERLDRRQVVGVVIVIVGVALLSAVAV